MDKNLNPARLIHPNTLAYSASSDESVLDAYGFGKHETKEVSSLATLEKHKAIVGATYVVSLSEAVNNEAPYTVYKKQWTSEKGAAADFALLCAQIEKRHNGEEDAKFTNKIYTQARSFARAGVEDRASVREMDPETWAELTENQKRFGKPRLEDRIPRPRLEDKPAKKPARKKDYSRDGR